MNLFHDQDSQRNRLENLGQYLPNHLTSPLSTSKVLVVGAGGIGCELLKNLVMGGFRDIEIVDLDTIDVSNLNRQFLFQKCHVSQPKAHVARSAALRFNNKVRILSRQADIKDAKFDLNYFKNFNLVLNALDNMDARRHVNKMCLQANVPLIESGSAGYLGQVTLIKKGFSECYDCQPKQPPKTYPICTIRSTPSLPIHCIVWAKSYLFNQLFGDDSEEQSNVIDTNQNAENREEIEKLQTEAQALKRLRDSMDNAEFSRNVFNKVFKDDISRLANIPEMWKTRDPPKPLDLEEILTEDKANGEVHNNVEKVKMDSWQKILSLKETTKIFLSSAKQLAERLLELRKQKPDQFLEFDKDDELVMTFVAATSNLRAHAYGIEKKSQFEAKAMAGNIIPAIATTNAIIAGLIVIQAYKVLMGQLDKCKTTFVVPGGKRQHLFINEPLAPPNPDCYVCSVSHYSLSVDTTHFTLKNLRDRLSHRYQEILGNEFESDDFQDISVSEGSRLLLDPDFDDNLGNTFESLGLSDGSTIQVSFEHPKLKTLNFIICHTELFTSLNKQDMIQRVKCPEHEEPVQNGDSKQTNGSSIQVEDDDDLIILEEEETTTTTIPETVNDATKRPISPTSINSPKPQQPSKVQKTEN